MKTYQTYRNLPAIAGICSMEEAARPGLSVEHCVARLKRCHYSLRRLHQIFIARLTSEPVYELKMAFSLHSHLCAEHVAALRKRIGEMREPPLGLDAVPHQGLERLFDEILAAPGTDLLLLGIYEKALPAVVAAFERHLAGANPLADHPSVRLCRFALLETNEMLDYGTKAISCLVPPAQRADAARWLSLLDGCLQAAGGLDGTVESAAPMPSAQYSATPFIYDKRPRRDGRFPDPYNMGVNAEVFLYDGKYPPAPKTLMIFYKRLREIDVPEMMASIIAETPNKPWDYHRDMTRQLWDEARHAMMGEAGFASLGVDWRKVMINFTWSLALNTQLKPIERHAVLYFIEQGLMPKTGKRFEWEVALASGNPLAGLFQDYDWADEVLHARVGRDWYVKEFDDVKKAIDYGDACWSKVLVGWANWRDEGLTRHRNWWPDVYRDACQQWGVEPDPEILAFSVTYEKVRADLKNLPASA